MLEWKIVYETTVEMVLTVTYNNELKNLEYHNLVFGVKFLLIVCIAVLLNYEQHHYLHP
jgi:hypothetical protein